MQSDWNLPFINQLTCPAFSLLDELFSLSAMTKWLDIDTLNTLKTVEQNCFGYKFINAKQVESNHLYYEQIIDQNKQIPTRTNNWHDLFNALVWLQFPRTKKSLNQLHIAEIKLHGLSPRTKLRSTATHFDECGLVPACSDKRITDLLAKHQWQRAFIELRAEWGKSVQPFVFGHANLEMLLKPFIGLTAKWLAIEVSGAFFDMDISQQLIELDAQLASKLNQGELFASAKPLKPIPLLGIPGWWHANQQPEFYQNTDYFRPKRY